MKLDIGKVYRQIEAMDTARVQFGWIPTMASLSVGQIGALSADRAIASAFCRARTT
jgi:hypothetical protein